MNDDPLSAVIQQLCPSDRALACDLLDVFGAAFEDETTYDGKASSDAYLAKLLAREHFIALVALVKGKVVGGLAAYEMEKLEQERSEIYIYDLAVLESHRRQQIATKLINALRKIASERGAWVVFVQADHGDDPAIALYTGLGTREDVLHFDIAVEDDGERTD
ncbi:MAG: AAC(3)-I family aminoglycoside N-acetyltransferase [Parasphingorhabdus sp.]|uniref:AAC(3)-I family aminoglycoside N-acetyltransferase n=1 Tax=Parasphingorhabdus sp. TaxID=2709688 RepID=UPI00329756F2